MAVLNKYCRSLDRDRVGFFCVIIVLVRKLSDGIIGLRTSVFSEQSKQPCQYLDKQLKSIRRLTLEPQPTTIPWRMRQ